MHDFLPMSREDMEKRGWDQCDFVYVCGDAYVDHPSFGHAIISRLLEDHGFHGESLFCVQKKKGKGFLYARRRHGKTARLRHSGLLQPDPVSL